VIAIVDYGLGNLASVRSAFRAVGATARVTADPSLIRAADGVVLPGVGAASAGMERIRARGLEASIQATVRAGTPVLGICLGMQLLFERSEEGDVPCLGLLPGSVRRLRGDMKVPHIGWNRVMQAGASGLWEDVPPDPYLYFVHSYACDPEDPSLMAGRTEYGEMFCSAVAGDSIWATQFHPERSGEIGLRLIRNFVRRCVSTRSAADTAVRM
jgi:glutamine amidotransferase